MLQFTLDKETDFSVAFLYQIGYFKNPPSARVVRGFKIVILDANQQVLYETVVDSGGATIIPGPITDQSLEVSSDKVSELSTYTFKF